jgi:KDO2-lipid IV(A) lauroyltransferase
MADRSRQIRDLRWRLEAAGYDLVSAVARALPVDAVSAFGGRLLKLLGPLTPTHRTALRNLKLAFPEWSEEKRQKLARDQWENVGRAFFEFLLVDKIMADPSRIEFQGLEHLGGLKSGRPMIFISGHFANWEIMAAASRAFDVEGVLAYRRLENPYIDKRIKESRRRYGIELFAPKGVEGGREVMAALAKGLAVGVLIDQKYNEGVAAPFFGHLVRTQHAPVRFAMRFGAILQPGVVQRTKGARFRVIAHAPIELQQTGDKEADVEAGVRQMNAFIEASVRERPHEWFGWVHRRFPAELYQALAAQGY